MSNAAPASCPDCGFVWDGVSAADAVSGINDAVAGFVGVIEAAGEMASVRPEPNRWSIVEYAGHVRDVLISLRERIIVASCVEDGVGTPIHRDERVNLGFYSLDSVDDVADELAFAAGLISKTIASVPQGYESRQILFSAGAMYVSIAWMTAQALHEAAHHLADARENLARISQ